MKFYRFEYYHEITEKYCGIYSACMSWRCKNHTLEKGCPGPNEDYLLTNSIEESGKDLSKYNFGFTSIDKLRSWFWDVEVYRIMSKKMRNMVYPSELYTPCLSVYDVPKYTILNGRYQSVVLAKTLEDSPVTRYYSLQWVSKVLSIHAKPDNRHADYYYELTRGNRYGY